MEGERHAIFAAKAQESLEGAASELANRRYYACFQAAVTALLREDILSPREHQWTHAFVQSQFAGTLIHRRKRYPSSLRDTLTHNLMLCQQADYEDQYVTEVQAQRALRRTRDFLETIRAQGGETP